MRKDLVWVEATLMLKRTNIGKAQQPAYKVPTTCGGDEKSFTVMRQGVTGIKTASDDASRLCGDIHECTDETPITIQPVQSGSGRKGEADRKKKLVKVKKKEGKKKRSKMTKRRTRHGRKVDKN